MRPISILLITLLTAAACADDDAAEPGVNGEPGLTDTLTTAEQVSFSVDLDRYSEMRNGRLDTVDMIGEDGGGFWHVQVINYRQDIIAMTHAAWNAGPDSVLRLAADGQPRLVDNLGNEYRGVLIPHNPRFAVEEGTTAVGVYAFRPALDTRADSLTLYINDSTPPVIRVGPFGVFHDHTRRPDRQLRMDAE